MKRHPQFHCNSWLTSGFLIFMSGLYISPSDAQNFTTPFEAPSAFGEMYILRQSGLLPEAEPTPGFPNELLSIEDFAAAIGGLGGDVIANNPADDTPERTTQSETSLAVLRNTICAGYNNSGPGGFSGLSRSTNLGATWTDLGGIGQSGDPVLAVHQDTGIFYYADIATIAGRPAIGVASSTNDCQSFAAPVNASPGASAIGTTTLNDKPWIAIDNTGGPNNGNIYVCWIRFDSANPSELRFSRSIDGGVTFVNEQIIAPGGTAPFGCSIGVGPNGEVHVAWADRAGATQNDIRFRSSTDGGQNFNAVISISTGNRHPGSDTIVSCPPDNRPTLTGDIRMLHQAWLAVDTTGGPFNGNIYVVWASDPIGTPDNSDVFFSRSTNGGAQWSAPVQIGAGGGATDQFEPFVAVGGFGTVSIAWYDRRNDPTNNRIDVFKTFSRDGGATLDPIVRVTDVNFPVPPINPNFDPGVVNCYMGEYITITSDANNFYYLWGDNRNTLVTASFPGGRPDPDVFFESQPVPPVVVGIDIKPGSFPNSIKLSNQGVIPVAILTTATFDATKVDPSTVCFGDAEDPTQRDCTEADGKGHIEDVDGDGDLDLVLHYETRQTGIDLGDTQACLAGKIFAGPAIQGCDSVRTL